MVDGRIVYGTDLEFESGDESDRDDAFAAQGDVVPLRPKSKTKKAAKPARVPPPSWIPSIHDLELACHDCASLLSKLRLIEALAVYRSLGSALSVGLCFARGW
jgi:hypothetical protein